MTRTTIFLLAGSAVMLAGCGRPAASTPDTQATAVAVSTDVVTARDVTSTFESGGIVRARVTAAIASRVMAPVIDIRVRAGDVVRRGAVLVALDARELQANHERAVASTAAARQSLSAAGADVASAEAAANLARATHARMAALVSRRSATQQELDQAVASLSAADAQVRGADARRDAAASAADASRAAEAAAQTALSYALLTAPFDGIVTERTIDPGAMATPGAPLLTLEDPASYQLEVRLDEARAAQVSVGSPVDVLVNRAGSQGSNDATDGWHRSRVSEIGRIDPASHGFLLKVELPADAARSGAFGRARFPGVSRRVPVVPASAVIRRGQLSFVYAVDSGTRARLRAVSVGADGSSAVEVLAGLTEGDVVVTSPPPALVDGSLVQRTASQRPAEAEQDASRKGARP